MYLGVEKVVPSFEIGQWQKEVGIMVFILLRLFTVETGKKRSKDEFGFSSVNQGYKYNGKITVRDQSYS